NLRCPTSPSLRSRACAQICANISTRRRSGNVSVRPAKAGTQARRLWPLDPRLRGVSGEGLRFYCIGVLVSVPSCDNANRCSRVPRSSGLGGQRRQGVVGGATRRGHRVFCRSDEILQILGEIGAAFRTAAAEAAPQRERARRGGAHSREGAQGAGAFSPPPR